MLRPNCYISRLAVTETPVFFDVALLCHYMLKFRVNWKFNYFPKPGLVLVTTCNPQSVTRKYVACPRFPDFTFPFVTCKKVINIKLM